MQCISHTIWGGTWELGLCRSRPDPSERDLWMGMIGHDHIPAVKSRDLSVRLLSMTVNRVNGNCCGIADAPVVRARLIGFNGTWFHGRLVHKRTWLQGSIRLRHGGTELRPLAGSGMKYKRAVRVDGELVEATSQLYQMEESDGTSSEVVKLS
ncbi:hypothetical protein F2Q69_00013294 [Brassica cretica]|uniref:Uncharacterized protein n=1 Tax=Brassica cretica TaxID=69181 RepID=A0A8S9QV09_BRACR|nr:hypothetical protein F2Q69_00013294 [Brassica cretica]